jgi:hypothetical protein
MRPLKNLIVAGVLLLLPAVAFADTIVFRCHAPHFIRAIFTTPANPEPNELRITIVHFNNADLQHEAVIQRLTIRDAFGTVRHESGPAVGVPHPLNLGIQDITTVPPGGMFALATSDLWASSLPPFAVQPPLTLAQQFFLLGGLTMTVEVSKRGNPRLFAVHAAERVRQPPLAGGALVAGAERSARSSTCFRIRDRNDG